MISISLKLVILINKVNDVLNDNGFFIEIYLAVKMTVFQSITFFIFLSLIFYYIFGLYLQF
jgi:hypothetical protein